MNIAHIVLNLECGGLEKLVIDLVLKLNERGVNTSIICLEKKGLLSQQVEKAGIKVYALDKKRGLDFKLIFKLAKLLKENKINVIHTHNLGPLIYGSLAAKLVGISSFNTRHGRTDKHVSSFIWNLNKNVVPVSEDTENHLLKFNKIAKNRLKVIYNGINLTQFNNSSNGDVRKLVRERIGLQENSFVIGNVGRLAPEKDQKTLVKAFANMIQKDINAELVIVGDGPLREELQQLSRELNVSNRIKFLGYRDDVADLIKALDVYVLSSTREGLSLSILEAMACGKPVVATKVGGSPEAVVNGETGFLVPSKDENKIESAILNFYDDRSLIEKMGSAGRERVKDKFSLDTMAHEYEQLYMKAIK